MSKIVALPAITGAQQSAIAARFRDAGWSVRGTSRTGAAGPAGATHRADLDTGEGLEAAFAGADVAVLTLPQDHRPGAMARIAATVARAAGASGVKRLVLNTAGTLAEDAASGLSADLREARQAVREGAAPFVVLQPTVFMDNLLAPWSLPAIVEQGVLAYPAPEAAPISWLSHRSLADYVFAAATAPDVAGQEFRIGGPEALTGLDVCARLSERLGRSIRYERIPLEDFAAGIDQAFGPPAGQRIASLYARLESEPSAMATDLATSDRLGVAPETFAAFAARQRWGR
jgi:NAD(P)H dehydrogenase (quinone)